MGERRNNLYKKEEKKKRMKVRDKQTMRQIDTAGLKETNKQQKQQKNEFEIRQTNQQ